MSEQPKTELYAAMAKAFDELSYAQMEGSGANTSVSHNTIKRMLRRAFQRCGLLWLPSEASCVTEPHVNKEGDRAGYMTTLAVDFTVVHAATGQSITTRASGQGFDSTDSGSVKAWSRAIKTWAIATFCIEAGFDTEKDDNHEPIDKDLVEKTFQRARKELRDAAPTRAKADETYAKMLGYYKTHSGRVVEDPREFKTRGDAMGALAALRQAIDLWAPDAMEREAKAKAGHVDANGKKSKARLTDAEMDAQAAKQEKV